MIDPSQLTKEIIRPVCKYLDLWSERAENLVLGTACKESECGRWLVQLGNGPALGIFQHEPATHDDSWKNFLKHRKPLARAILALTPYKWPAVPDPREMIWNLRYATAMCRVKYLRDPKPIPPSLRGQAEYWKRVYNTAEGAGTVEEYLTAWRRFME